MVSLYIHIPFCKRKCPYCSFVVSIGQLHHADAYLDCLEAEAWHYGGREVKTIYIGGGTPTMMSAACLKRLSDIVHAQFRLAPGAEWTIEANPEGLDASKLELLKDAGVNRISLGVQSLDDRYLKYLGRNHDAVCAMEAYQQFRQAGFKNINVDLMFAFPGQTLDELRKDIMALISMGSEHISLYGLTVEERSRFYAQKVVVPDDRHQALSYELVCGILDEAGYQQYEVSNFARPLRLSEHNLNYWRQGQYIGLGVGAHSHISTKRFWNSPRLHEYMHCLQHGILAQDGSEELTTQDRFNEALFFGLRMNSGVHLTETEKLFTCFLTQEQRDKIAQFIAGGFLSYEDGFLRASPKGRLVLDELSAQLI